MDKQDREDTRAERWRDEAEGREDLRFDIEETYAELDFAEGSEGPKKGRRAPTEEEDDSLDAEIRRNFASYDRDVVMARADQDEMNKVRRLGAQIKGMHGTRGPAQALEHYIQFDKDLRERPVETLTHLARIYDPNFRAQVEAREHEARRNTIVNYMETAGVSEAVEREIYRQLKNGTVKIDPSDPVGTLRRAHQAALEGMR